MSKSSILMVIANYRGVGGHGVVMKNLCQELNKIGYETSIGAFSFTADPPEGVGKVKLKKFQSFLSSTDDQDFDIIHSHQTFMNYFALFTPRPLLFHYHGANGLLQEINLKISLALCRKKILKIISVSNEGVNQLKKISKNVSAITIYNGVDTKSYNTTLKPEFKKGEPQLLFVGNLYTTKKVWRLIEQMPELLKLYPKAHLQIVGEGEDYQKLKTRIENKKLEGNVELVGRVSKDELPVRYASCDVYVSGSDFEVCPVPTLEAMSCGKPLVLSDIKPHIEILNESHAGEAVSFDKKNDFANKVKMIHYNKKKYSLSARKFAEEHDWSSVAKKVANVYEEILK